jgi:PAS domain S-box-containing protein
MKRFTKITLKRLLPLLLIICTVLGGFASIVYRHILYHGVEREIDQKICNQTAKMAIGSAIVNNLQKVESQFYKLSLANNQQKQKGIIDEAKKRLVIIHTLLNILEKGGTFSQHIPLNIPNIDTMLLDISYDANHRQQYIVEILELRPELVELEEKIKWLMEVTAKRNRIFQNGSQGVDLVTEEQRIRHYIKKTASLFTRMTENSHKILFDGEKSLKLLYQENKQKRKIELKFGLYWASLSAFIVLLLVGFILRQIFVAQENLEGAVEELEQKKVDLQFKNSEIKKINDSLEAQVEYRTGKLTKSNKKLLDEIITRKKGEDRLRRSKEEWEKTFDAISDIITIQDKDMRIIRGNQAARAFSGLEEDQLVGKKCHEVFHGISAVCPGCPVHSMIVSNHNYSAIIEHEGQGKTFLVSCTPIFGGQNTEVQNIVHVARDITEQKKLEEQFYQSQKMESIGHLAGGIAHDFNNILTVIKGYSQIAKMQMEKDSKLWHDVREIEKAGDRAAGLTRQLLGFSRKQMIIPKTVAMNDLITNMGKMLGRLIGEDIHLETSLDEQISNIYADPSQLEQIVMNLVVNARDAVRDQPERAEKIIKISTFQVFLDKKYVAGHLGSSPGWYLQFQVEDNGCGMSEEVIKHVFEPFYTTKDVGKGTGMGLATVYGIVKQNQGSIYVSSELGRGTTVTVNWPVIATEDAEVKLERPEELTSGGNEVILLAEDEQQIREITNRQLQEAGYTVIETEHGLDALEQATHYQGTIDLLFTDVVIPVMGGKELSEKIKEIYPNILILFGSGYMDDSIHQDIIDLGEDHFINKPYNIQDIMAKIRRLLDNPAS